MDNKNNARLGKGLSSIFGQDVSKVLDDIQNGDMEVERQEQSKIPVDEIRPNPYQPRKVFNDEALKELSSSIKQHGVFTPILVKKSIQGYDLIAGERRLRASKLAGLKDIPAIIVDFDDQEMMEIALLENIQREDLTIQEQAQGFQMMLDLGDTEDQIAEKTGFSKSTVRHRLNIAKLDQEKLKEKQQDDAFQLTLKDLYELEKIKDVEMRNEILDKAGSSRDIVSRVQNEITNAKKKENAKKLKAKLKKMGVEKAPEQYSQQMYNGKWKTVIEFNLADDVPDEINLPEQKEQMYWYETWRDLRIVTKAPKEKKKPTKEELAKKEQERKSKEIKEILKGSAARRKKFIAGIISGKIPALKDENAAREKIWDALVLIGYGLYGSVARGFFLEGDEWKYSEEERKQANETFKGLSITHQMLVFLHGSMITVGETYDYSGRYAKEKADKLLKGYEALELFGWFFEMDEEKQVLDGTSELFAPAEEK